MSPCDRVDSVLTLWGEMASLVRYSRVNHPTKVASTDRKISPSPSSKLWNRMEEGAASLAWKSGTVERRRKPMEVRVKMELTMTTT